MIKKGSRRWQWAWDSWQACPEGLLDEMRQAWWTYMDTFDPVPTSAFLEDFLSQTRENGSLAPGIANHGGAGARIPRRWHGEWGTQALASPRPKCRSHTSP